MDAGLASPAAHTLDRDEVFMVTEGVLVLQEGAPPAGPGDTVVVPAGQPIRLSNPGATPATALVAISAGFSASAEDGTPIPTPTITAPAGASPRSSWQAATSWATTFSSRCWPLR
mgnify:CR=1 FL=1